MSLTKRELVNEVASKLGLTQNEVSGVVQELLDAITQSLVEGNRLEIRNFGVFEVKDREARIGRNPRTGEEVPIPRKRVTTFRPGKALKEWVEAGPEHRPHHLFKTEDYDDHAERSSSSPESTSSSAPVSRPPHETGRE